MTRAFVLFLGLALAAKAQVVENAIDFDTLDGNKDNKIEFAEFQKWYLANKGHKEEADLLRLFKAYDADGDAHLSVPEFVPLAYELSRTPRAEVDRLFHRLDRDHDGVLTRAELRHSDENLGAEIVEGLFLAADADADARITHEEFRAIQTAFGRPNPRSESVGAARALMDAVDADGDDRLSVAEVLQFVARFNQVPVGAVQAVFAQLDADADRALSLQELRARPEAITDLAGFNQPMPRIN